MVILFFLLSKFYLGKQNESEIMEERDEEMRGKYHHPIEHFPDKIDQFLDVLDRVCDCIFLSVFYDFNFLLFRSIWINKYFVKYTDIYYKKNF